jgi:hypothetical protein
MSERELVDAYLDGRISRRTLVRRLVGAGISIGAAVSYAQVLKPERAFAVSKDSDHYPDATIKIVEEDLDKVVNKGRLLVKVNADEDCEFDPLRLTAYLKEGGVFVEMLGQTERKFSGPKIKNVEIELTMTGSEALATRDRAKIYVSWRGYDKQGKLPNGADTAVLKS